MVSRYHLGCFLVATVVACGRVDSGPDEAESPTITSISPDRGPAVGGITITVTGTNLDGGTASVVVGNRLATDVAVTSATELTFKLPEGVEGEIVDVTVANDKGFGTTAQAFTYNFRPTLLSVSPPIGRAAGGTAITIQGRGFQNAGDAKITIGGGDATNVVVVDDQTVTATTAAVAADTPGFTPLDVVLENANGQGTLEKSFKVTKQGLLVLDRQNPTTVFHVDTTSGAVARIGSLSERVTACALNPGNNTLFGKGGQGFPNHKLVTFDPLTGTVNTVGLLNEGGETRAVVSLTFNGNNLLGFSTGCSGPPCTNLNRLLSINQATGAVTTIGATPIAGIDRGVAIAPQNAANVFMATRLEQSLDTVAVASSTRTTGLAFSGGNPQGQPVMGMVNVAGTLFLLERANPGGVIYKVDPATAVLVKLAEVSTPGLAHGLCQTPSTF